MPEQNNGQQYSTSVGLIYIFNLIVGTGALTLPAVFSRAGWLLGLIVVLILAFMSFVTVTFVIEAMASANAIITRRKIQQRKRVGVVQESSNESETEAIGDSGRTSSDSEETPLVTSVLSSPERNDMVYRYYVINEKIELGEMASIFFNKFGKTLFYICLTVYLYGDLSIYGAVIGKSTADIFCTYVPKNFTCNDTIPDTELCWESTNLDRMNAYRLFLTLFVLLLGPFVFFNVQKTKYLQLLTSAMRWLAFSIMIIYASWKIINYGVQGNPPLANVLGVPGLFGACVYSFMCHHSLPAVVSPIANKSTLNRSLALDYSLIAFFYILLAMTGIFAFQHLDDLYTLDFGPRGSGDCTSSSQFIVIIVEYFLALFPVFTLSTSFPIIGITLRNNLQSLFLEKDRNYNRCYQKVLFPLMTILPPYAIAMTTKDLKKLVEITGSFGGTAIQYLIPTFLVYFARKKTSRVIGMGVINNFASPFKGQFWLLFVVLWAVTCMIFVIVNLVENNFKS